MAPSQEEAHLAKVLMTFMGQISARSSSRYDKKIAESPELKSLLFYLLERVPSRMHELLKSASRKCDDVLRVEKEARIARKRAEPPNENKSTAKRVKVAHPTEKQAGLSQGVEKSDSAAQVRDHMWLSSRKFNADSLNPRDVLTLFRRATTLFLPAIMR